MAQELEVNAWVFGCTDVGRVRKNNEDAFVISDLTENSSAGSFMPAGARARTGDTTERGDEGGLRKCRVGLHGLLFAVSDGMGGAEAGEIASHLVVESLKEDLSAKHDKSTGPLIRAAVERANHVVFDAAISHPRRNGMGATLTAVLVREDRAYIAGEVLATSLDVGTRGGTTSSIAVAPGSDGAPDAFSPSRQHAAQTFDLDGREVRVTLSKDES